ncbi:hypothetical protein ABFS82_04G097300 [Erythranthe guttata]|uniref:Dof zinc finger protein n=1 Tax=Erythranthe guttata TaxID=4155 RepID=A0A022S1T0_ERYGU|nr:PREDICTED: dof zinc finger protein DOF3.1-like [Erythranthe guttata]EYU45848.1 hypothetical protein MIMGU_mgv1a013541mg [Erythranthe guttata]|eukprot:XP_012839763.1 PREDICTED: dof zinc finger protein DOF3.1-like [Erythranthe guttata]
MHSSLYYSEQANLQFPEQEYPKCPRCDSADTKFCYYNNYNLSQPRYLCKSCKRYWTKGGALRNIPVGGGGGGSRKTAAKRTSSSSPASPSAAKRPASAAAAVSASNDTSNSSSSNNGGGGGMGENLIFGGQFGNFMDACGSFKGEFGNLLDGLDDSSLLMSGGDRRRQFGDPGSGRNSDPLNGLESGGDADGFLNIHGGGGGGWPDLSIHTPGSTSQ